MTTKLESVPVRDRILAVACDLFYRQGYRATGINQVIAESRVAKASFYVHFRSKDDLLLAYALETARREFEDLRNQVMALPIARERFFGPMRVLIPWFEGSNYRGCPFQNLMAEIPPGAERVRDVARQHRENLRGFFRYLLDELLEEDTGEKPIRRDELVDTYLILFDGAIAMAVAYRASWPVERAIAALEACLARQ